MRYLAIGYTLLIAYASLYPFRRVAAGTRRLVRLRACAVARYYTWSDVGLNLLAYVPLGFFSALAALARFGALAAAVLATGLGAALSLFMEFLQQFTASRVASNLDLLSNALGALAGVLLAVTLGRRWVLGGRLYQARAAAVRQARMTDLGFVLLLLWLFTQLKPQIWLFGNGESHWLLSMPEIGCFRSQLAPLAGGGGDRRQSRRRMSADEGDGTPARAGRRSVAGDREGVAPDSRRWAR